MKRTISWGLSMFKYIIALFMMYAGVATFFVPLEQDSRLGFIYENRVALVLFGLYFIVSGMLLFIGKIAKMRKTTGHGLFLTYNAFLFGFILNWVGLSFSHAWANLVAAVVVGGLYLRWKYHIYYYEPALDKVREKMLESEPLDDDR